MSEDKHPQPQTIKGIHHIKLPSKNILATQAFYTKILNFTPLPHFNHYTASHKLFAVLFEHTPSQTILEARYAPDLAESNKGWDPITWAVSTRKDLEEWGKWLDVNGVKHSAVLTGIKSWLMVAEDPDGRHVRLYVADEEHEWSEPSVDEYWLPQVVADPNAEED